MDTLAGLNAYSLSSKYVKLRPGKAAEIKFTPAARGPFEFVFVCEMKEAGRPHRELGMPGELVAE